MPADSIESVIQASVDHLTADDSGGDVPAVDTTVDTPAADVAAVDTTVEAPVVDDAAVTAAAGNPAVADAADPDKPAVVEDPFAKEHGLKPVDKIGRENRIPFSRVKKITENAVKKAKAEWDKTATPAAETVAKVAEYEGRLTRIGETERILFNEPARFLGILRTIKGYAELLGDGKAPATTAAATSAVADAGPMPAPDGEGGTSYTPAGLAKLLDWTANKATLAAVAQTEERLGKRYEPIEKAFTQHQSARQLDQTITTNLDNAAKWPGFNENAPAILAVLQADKAGALSLEDAYRQVLHGKTDHSALEATLRKQILDELKAAPRATAASGAAGAGARRGEPETIEDTIRASIAGLK